MNTQDEKAKKAYTILFLMLFQQLHKKAHFPSGNSKLVAEEILQATLTYQQLIDYPTNRKEVANILENYFKKNH